MPPPLPVDVVALLDLGRLGQTHALEVVAGRCTAAQALGSNACVRRSSTSLVPKTWDDFYRTHLKISETESNRTIHLLDEFGPDYFDLSALTRISPETYRAIAPAVKDGALQLDGEAIALRPENSREVTAAVAEMRGSIQSLGRNLRIYNRIVELDKRSPGHRRGVRGNRTRSSAARVPPAFQLGIIQGARRAGAGLQSRTGPR